MITIEEFNNKFILDFDNYLTEQDNSLVNSNEYYLQYKNEYMISTNKNADILKELLVSYNQLYNNYNKSTSKYIYNYIDKSEYNIINNKIKNLILEQSVNFNNFMNHINFLNNNLKSKNTVNLNSNNSRMTKLSKK